MKKIAITQRLIENNSYYELRDCLDTNWNRLFQHLNFVQIILPTNCDFETYHYELNIDGIILSGGNDLNSINSNNLSNIRDNFEKNLIRYAINNNIPILGICRGMQILGEFFGLELEKVTSHINLKHEITINKNSKYYESLSKIKEVNSYHNYSIKNIDNNFIVSAFSKDNKIEAIEHKNLKIFAQMWHTEREEPFVKEEVNFIKNFFNYNIKSINYKLY
ncbi:MAG: gamma-glutamyl-gamma-aminobutyrate hydrolase family protein [Candidatus Sericytochromatia bacterium]